MLKKIHVPLLFHYRECDSFTDYLHRQSLKGWHFKEFRFGMVFEKGEPQKKYYSAEVFPEGSEYDLRPDTDAMEYAGYCEAAGWKFLDGIRKFCVFERIRENAVPIITEEEKLANILKSEKQNWLLRYLPLLLFLVFYLPFMLLQHFSDIAFQSALLFIMLGFFLYLILSVEKGVSILLWYRRAKGAINEGHPIFCKSRLPFLHLLEPLLVAALLFLAAYYAIRENSVNNILPYAAVFLAIPVLTLALSTFRPNRRQQMNVRMISALAVLVLSIIGIVFFNTPDSRPANKVFPKHDILLPSDFTDAVPDPDASPEYDYSQSLLGSRESCSIWYTSSSDTDTVHHFDYTIYRPSYLWVRNFLWRQSPKDYSGVPLIWEDCSDSWSGLEALKSDFGFGTQFRILYKHAVLDLWLDSSLNPEQISQIESRIFQIYSLSE